MTRKRMLMQEAVYTISPAVRGHYTEQAPHILTLRLSWTRRRVSAPAPAEEREAARVLQEAEAQEPGGRQEGCHAPPRAVHQGELRCHCRPPRVLRHHHQPVSRSEHGLPQGPRIDHPWWPSVVCSLERTAPYRTSQTSHGLLSAEQSCVDNTGSSRSYHCLKTIQEQRIGAGSQRHHQG